MKIPKVAFPITRVCAAEIRFIAEIRCRNTQNSENLRITNTRMKIFLTQNQSVLLPESRSRPKNINKKRSSLKFSLVFGPKSGENPIKRYLLKFSPVFGPKLGEGQKQKSSPTVSVLKPSAQLTKGRGACHNFAYYFMLIILS